MLPVEIVVWDSMLGLQTKTQQTMISVSSALLK
jgi:hypothetical protein